MTPVIEVSGLSKSYGHVQAIRDLNFSVMPGEIFGFLGLNGAGKSTTIRALLGMIRPQSGVVRLFSAALTSGTNIWQRVGHLVESASAYPELTVRENLDAARRLYGVAEKAATDRAIELFTLGEYAQRKAGTLSTGNRQRLALARAFQHNPELLILDEPATGLDPAGVVEIRQLLWRVSRETGTTVFMSSHLLSEVSQLATRIGVIRGGMLVDVVDMKSLQLALSRLVIEARDLPAAEAALVAAGYRTNRSAYGELQLQDERAIAAPDLIATLLVQAGTPPTRLAVQHDELETYFLRRVAGDA